MSRVRAGMVATAHLLGKLLVPSIGLVTYCYLFQLTKQSALSIASVGDQVSAAAYMLLAGWALALVALTLATILDLGVLRVTRGRRSSGGTLTVLAGGYAVGFLLFAENLLYSATGEGLKTDDRVVTKVVLGVMVVSFGILAARQTAEMSARAARRLVAVLGVAGILAVGLAVVDHARTSPSPDQATTPARPWNVIILSSDGIDANRMSVYGYARETTPFLDEKAAEFSVFENAFTNNGNTTGSIVSLLNGISPLKTGVVYPPDALSKDDATRTLPYILGTVGYRRENWAVPHYADAHDQNLVDAFDDDNGRRQDGALIQSLPLGNGPGRWLVDDSATSALGVALDVLGVKELDNPYAAVSSHVTGDVLGDEERLDHIVRAIASKRPVFVNAHFMVTHGPAFQLPTRTFSRGVQTQAWEPDFYDDSLVAFDGYVRTVYRALERSGELDSTILVVTSDHGMRYDAKKRVPLLVRFPSADPAGRVSVNVQRLDVAPTVLKALGLEVPSWMTGMDLAHPELIPTDREILATSAETRTFTHHIGFRSRADGLLVTAIKCTSYVEIDAGGDEERGPVLGSTAGCDQLPTTPARR